MTVNLESVWDGRKLRFVGSRKIKPTPADQQGLSLPTALGSHIATAVPSDHLRTGTMNAVIGSGAPWKSGSRRTGEPGRSEPQLAWSVWGT